jgi:hypothetical protein
VSALSAIAAIQFIFDGTGIFNDADQFVCRKIKKTKMQISSLFRLTEDVGLSTATVLGIDFT